MALVYRVTFHIEKDGAGVQHHIKETFEYKKEIRPDPSGSGMMRVAKSVPEHLGGSTEEVIGYGNTVSVAIADWIRNLCGKAYYDPVYKKKKEG